MSKRASEESPSDLPCPQIEGTYGFVFVTRGGVALGIARAGMVGKIWNILSCSNWAFFKVLSSNLYSYNECPTGWQILGGLELPWNGKIMALMRAHKGQKSIVRFSPHLVARLIFSLTRFQIFISKLPSSGNQGFYLTTVWRQASICWHETESPWNLNKWWSKVEKWWGFSAV